MAVGVTIIPQDHFYAREIPEHPGCIECWDPHSFTGRLAKRMYPDIDRLDVLLGRLERERKEREGEAA